MCVLSTGLSIVAKIKLIFQPTNMLTLCVKNHQKLMSRLKKVCEKRFNIERLNFENKNSSRVPYLASSFKVDQTKSGFLPKTIKDNKQNPNFK